jgi:hypothetical protein
MRVTWRQVARWRLRRQLLDAPAPDAVAVARRVCGLHAQVASCTALIAGIRAAATPDLDAALWAGRSLIRTWAMRGTLHLLPADELALWVGALTDRESRRRFPPSWEREHGVTGDDLHAITGAVGEVLGATPLTRAELAAAVCAHLKRPDLAGPLATGWGALLKPAAARGLLCSGPAVDGAEDLLAGSRIGRATFVSPAAWLGRAMDPPPADEANREVLLRFLAANGPATAADVARWWGEQPAPARRWIREAGAAVTPVTVDGEPGFVVRTEDADELAAVPDEPDDAVVLLPGFDPWVLAPISHRRRAVPVERERDVSRTAGWISPVVVADGSVVGVWEHALADATGTVAVRPFGRVPQRVRAGAARHAQRYGPLLGAASVRVVWDPAVT